MLSIYKNTNELIKTPNSAIISRFDLVDRELLPVKNFNLTFLPNTKPTLEFHVYTPDGIYLTGNNNALYSLETNNHIAIDVETELANLGISRGSYRIVYNIFDSTLSNLWIKEISPSRTELKLHCDDIRKLNELKVRWEIEGDDDILDLFLLNFGKNETFQITNFRFDNNDLYVKLYSALPQIYTTKQSCSISEELVESQLDNYSIVPIRIPEQLHQLKGPNFNIDEFEGSSIATDFRSWTDLLSSNTQTSQQLIDTQFSGSLSGIELNINYHNFDNFVHFSSATERVKNFHYKLALIEYFTTQIQTTINVVSGSNITTNNLIDLYNNRNKIVSGFDDFEKYLFFESDESRLYTHYTDVSGSLTGIAVLPWPKTSSTSLTWQQAYMTWASMTSTWTLAANPDPYNYFGINQLTTSTIGSAYYENLLENAELYDRRNIHKLENTIPQHIQSNSDNDDYILFINMLGQHFDILWTYIGGLAKIHIREEHPDDGVSSDLLYDIASSMGLKLLNGRSSSELWKYVLGVDSDGESIRTITDSKNTKEIWRRIVNNLPLILKSKGTSRSIKALLTCFGIPSTLLTIKEFGGPSTFTEDTRVYEQEKFHYVWNSSSGSISFPVNRSYNDVQQTASVLEFRFRTSDIQSYNDSTYYNLFSVNTYAGAIFAKSYHGILSKLNDVAELTVFNVQSGNSMTTTFDIQDIFDNSWHNVVVSVIDGSTGSLHVAKSLYGKSIYVKSASYNGGVNIFSNSSQQISFASSSISFTPVTLTNGNTVSSIDKFNGDFQEIRIWSGSISVDDIKIHSNSPFNYSSYDSYNRLKFRFPLSSNQIVNDSFLLSTHPATFYTASLEFNGYATSSSIDFEAVEETYYSPATSLGASSFYSNKIRIDSQSLDATLNVNSRAEKSSLDKYSKDSNKIGVYFSPQQSINEDIINQLGYFSLDDYIGDSADNYNSSYSQLTNFSKDYWKKFTDKTKIEDYFKALAIYDFTLFKYIKQLLPARSNTITGLVVEPTLLERSKVIFYKKPVIDDSVQDVILYPSDYELNANYDYIEADAVINDNTIESINIQEHSAAIEINYLLTGDVHNIETTINNNGNDVDKLGTSWVQHRYIGKWKITESGSYYPIQTIVTGSRLSNQAFSKDYFYSTSQSASLNIPYSSSLRIADINSNTSRGYINITRNGSKLSGTARNINSLETCDGGPVVKVTDVNPQQMIYTNGQVTTQVQQALGQNASSV